MTPPRRDPLDDGRRRLDEAAGALDGMRRLTGTGDASAGSPSESVRREALTAARDDLRRTAADLEAARARGAVLLDEVARLREELAARPTELQLEQARAAGAADGLRRAEEMARQVIGLKERVSLLSAEHVRLETLRRKAEAFGADSEASRRAMEETLRRDLRAAHAALDRAAAESGTRDAKAVSEIEEMRKRLDHALGRLQREDLSRKQAKAEESSSRGDYENAQAVIAALRRELSELRAGAQARERALAQRVHELELRPTGRTDDREEALRAELREAHAALDRAGARRAAAGAAEEALKKELRGAQAALDKALERCEASASREESLRNGLRAANAALERSAAQCEASGSTVESLRNELRAAQAAPVKLEETLRNELRVAHAELENLLKRAPEDEAPLEPGFAYPALEYALEPGWAKLLALLRPPVQAAYAHLRHLSAGPMSAGQRAIVRLTGSSLSQAADSLATIELALSEAPAAVGTAPLLPVLEAALAAWEAVFRRRGIALKRDLSISLPAPHDPEQLRLALHHLLRNAVEALPRGGTLNVRLGGDQAGATIEFRDNGPGYPAAWLERRFEPFASPRPGHAGLGLAAVRRTLRRWGGDASAGAAEAGRGARLTLTFAGAPDR